MLFESIPVPDERARAVALAVRRLDIEYRSMRSRVAEDAGLSTAELDVLAALAGADMVTPKQLAQASHLTTSAMTALLDRLSASGLLRREPHPTDRRSVVVALTPPGERLATDIFRRFVGRFETLLGQDSCVSAGLDEVIVSLGCLAGAVASTNDEGRLAAIA